MRFLFYTFFVLIYYFDKQRSNGGHGQIFFIKDCIKGHEVFFNFCLHSTSSLTSLFLVGNDRDLRVV